MELVYYKDEKLNFGDDLNAVLWPHILSKRMYATENIAVVGIGSILNQERLGRFEKSSHEVIVLGSGTSYDVPPRQIHKWHVHAVRGPLTAELIGMPEKAVTDGAILLADAPELVPATASKTDVVFIPHHRTIRASPWARIAHRAGMTFVSPQQPVEKVLKALSKAKLVVTEAMHGAIVADTMRIPWLPVIISPAVDEFKWRDWCRSMEVPFEPVQIPAGHPDDRWRYSRMRRVLERAGIKGHRMLEEANSREQFESYFARRFSPATNKALLRCGSGKLGRLVVRLTKPVHSLYESQAARALKAAAAGFPYLSRDEVFDDRLNRMREAVLAAERIAYR
jgi:hypothetical protein